MSESTRKYLLNIVIILFFTIGVLWFALKDNFSLTMSLISNVSLPWLLLILLWGIAYAWIIGMILTLITRRYKKDFKNIQGFQNALVGSFFSGITPSATGGQFAQVYLFKKQGIKLSDAASILWADFIIYQTTMMVYVTVLFMLRYSYYVAIIGPWLWTILIGYAVNLFVICVLWTMALFPKLYIGLSQKVVSLLARMHIIKNKEKTLASWTIQVEGFTSEIKRLHHEKKLIIKAVCLSIVRMTFQFTLPFVIAKAFHLQIGWDLFIDSMALSSFVLMVNAFFPVPGASGGTEFAFTQLFSYLVGKGAAASSIMILWRFSTYHIVLIAGAIMFIYLQHYYRSYKYRLKQNE